MKIFPFKYENLFFFSYDTPIFTINSIIFCILSIFLYPGWLFYLERKTFKKSSHYSSSSVLGYGQLTLLSVTYLYIIEAPK